MVEFADLDALINSSIKQKVARLKEPIEPVEHGPCGRQELKFSTWKRSSDSQPQLAANIVSALRGVLKKWDKI